MTTGPFANLPGQGFWPLPGTAGPTPSHPGWPQSGGLNGRSSWMTGAGLGPTVPLMSVPPSALDPVGQTAQWVAAARAVESQRPDRLFDDPYAVALAGQDGARCLQVLGVSGKPIVDYLAMRTWYLDDLIASAVGDTGIRQVVILAAGMDTRAFRLPWPEGTHVYELDRPAVLAVKDAILTKHRAIPSCQRHTIGIDLTLPWTPALVVAGFQQDLPTVWLTEGLLMYLNPTGVHHLLQTITALSAPGSVLGGDLPNPPAPVRPMPPIYGSRWTTEQPAKQQFGTDDPAALLSPYGWQTTTVTPDDVARQVHRPPVSPFRMPDGNLVHNRLFKAERA